jgi:hypothetical protein
MAISPNALSAKLQEEATNFEKQIDTILSQKILSKGSISITAPSKMKYEHYEILKPRYLSAGWVNLEWESYYDQRDGEYFTSLIFYSLK